MCFNPPPTPLVFQQAQKSPHGALHIAHGFRNNQAAAYFLKKQCSASSRPNHKQKQSKRCENHADFIQILNVITWMPLLCICKCLVAFGEVSIYVAMRIWVRGSGLKVRFRAKSFNYHCSLFHECSASWWLQLAETETNLKMCSLISCPRSHWKHASLHFKYTA